MTTQNLKNLENLLPTGAGVVKNNVLVGEMEIQIFSRLFKGATGEKVLAIWPYYVSTPANKRYTTIETQSVRAFGVQVDTPSGSYFFIGDRWIWREIEDLSQ